MVATAEQTGRKLESATADPAPPGAGEDGYPERVWEVDGEVATFSLKPYPDGGWGTPSYDPAKDKRPRYWYIGVGARLRVKAQRINEFGIQPVVLNDVFIDGSFFPRNAWEEHVTRDFLRRNHVDPDRSRDERHPEGPDARWICDEGMCNFACPSWHVFDAHQRARGHKGLRRE